MLEMFLLLVLILGIIGVAIVLPIIAISKVSTLQARLTKLSAELRDVQKALALRAELEREHSPSAAEEREEPVASAQPTKQPPLGTNNPTPVVETAAPAVASKPSSVSLESIIGGKVLSRVGAVAIVVGALLFFKWAVDNNIISELARVVIGVCSGILAMLGAARLRRRGQHLLGQGVVAIGSSVLYLSIYAAFNWYSLIPHPVAYVAMMVVTMLSAWRALVHHSPFLAALAAFAGFVVPGVVPSPNPSSAALFTHIIFIDGLVIATIALRRTWQPLYSLAFIGTCCWQWIWFVNVESVASQQPVAPFMAVLFIALTLGIMPMNRARHMQMHPILGTTLWGLALTAFALFFLFTLQGASALVADVALACTAAGIYGTGWFGGDDGNAKPLREAAGVAAFATLMMATYVHHSVVERAIVASIAAAICTGLSKRDGTRIPVMASLMTLIVAVFVLMQAPSVLVLENRHIVPAFTNLRFAAIVVLASSLWFVVRVWNPSGTLATVRATLLYLPTVVAVFAVALEVHHLLAGMADRWAHTNWQTAEHYYWLSDVAMISIFTAGAALLPSLSRWFPHYRFPFGVQAVAGIGALAFLARVVDVEPSSAYVFITNARVGLALVIAVSFGIGWRLSVVKDQHRTVSAWMAWMPVLLVTFATASFEAVDPWNQRIDRLVALSDWDSPDFIELESARALSLSLTWIGYAAIVVAIGFLRTIRALRLTGIVILGVAVLKVFAWDLSELEIPYRILSFIALGLVLLVVSFFYGRLRKHL